VRYTTVAFGPKLTYVSRLPSERLKGVKPRTSKKLRADLFAAQVSEAILVMSPNSGLHTLGSTQKGRLYESVAVPELRGQAADLAAHLLNVVARSSSHSAKLSPAHYQHQFS
jgi:hypothetical protein